MARIVVVGAGVGGLAAGIRLAAAGHRVTICEQQPSPGGKLGRHVVRTASGEFVFDTGPTLLTLPQVFEQLFAETGAPLSDVLPVRRLDTIAQYRFADGASVDTVDDLDRQYALFDAALGSGAGASWRRLVQRGGAIWRAVEGPVFGSTLSARQALTLAGRLAHVRDLSAVAPHRTLRALGRELLDDPRQRLMLERYATYEGSDPRRAPAALAVVPYLEHRFGAWYVEGGTHRLADALADRFRALGGELRLGTRVTRIAGPGRVRHVETSDAQRLPADVVVCNADAHVLYGELLQGDSSRAGRLRRRHVPPADSLSGFVLLLAVRDALPELGHHTVLYGSSPYDNEFDSVFGRRGRLGRHGAGRPVPDPVLYLNAPRDPATAPDGCRAVYVLVNAPRHGVDGSPGTVDWKAPGLADRYVDTLLDLLAERGVDVRDRLAGKHIRTPADLERTTGAPGGAIYGKVQHGPFATVGRPHNRSLTRGLFLVGGSTHPGGGLPLVAMSARAVAADIGPA